MFSPTTNEKSENTTVRRPSRTEDATDNSIVQRASLRLFAELDFEKLVAILKQQAAEICGADFALFATHMSEVGTVRIDDTESAGDKASLLFSRFLLNPKDEPGRAPRSILVVPLIQSSGETIGGLLVGHAEAGRFTDRDQNVLEGWAQHAGVALGNALIFKKTKTTAHLQARRVQQALLAADIGIALTKNPPLPELLQSCCEALVRHLDAAFARVWKLNEHEQVLELQASAGLYTHLDGQHSRVPVGAFKIGRIAEDRAAVLTNDVPHDPRVGDREWAKREGLIAFAGYPLIVDGRVLGVVAMFSHSPLDEDTLHGLASIADLISLGIERKRVDDERRQSELRYSQILDSIQDMVFCKRPGSVVVYANRAACTHYGMSATELRGVTEVPFNKLDYTQQYLADDLAVFTTGNVVENRAEPNVRADGETRLFHTVKSPIFNEAGQVIELVGVSRDVTQLIHKESIQQFLGSASSILASSIEYETTLANVAALAVPTIADWAAVDVLQPDGTLKRLAVAHVDPSKIELAHELERRWPSDPKDTNGVQNVVRTGRAEMIPLITDEVLVAACKNKHPDLLDVARALGLRSSICVPLMVHGKALGAITFVNAESGRLFNEADLEVAEELGRRAAVAVENARLFAATKSALEERDRALDEVRTAAATLERRVEERTEELTAANAELEAFSYTVSHDLRAPIRHISGFVDMLKHQSGGALDSKGTHYLRTIGDAAKQMGLLIDALLAFSRMGRTELHRRPVDLAAIVRLVVRELEPDTVGRKITWEVGELPSVSGDPVMLQIVFANLLSNAVKYTSKQETSTIRVSSRHDTAANEVVVTIEDNGIGFNMAYINKLFGVFQRLHLAKEFEGTGIGLATVKRIVQRHGGRVWANGEEGKGASFSFALPDSTSDAAAAHDAANEQEAR